jgi:hypothetical protein
VTMYVIVYTVVPCLLMPIAMGFMVVVAFLVPLGVASVMHYGASERRRRLWDTDCDGFSAGRMEPGDGTARSRSVALAGEHGDDHERGSVVAPGETVQTVASRRPGFNRVQRTGRR